MTFGEKLDFIMNITSTTNSVLARAISIDPSLVSRLRRGDRTPSKNQNYIRAMAEYFARNCTTEYQKAALTEMLQKDLPINNNELTALIDAWFLEEIMPNNSVANFIDGLTNFQFRRASFALDTDNPNVINNNVEPEDKVFYGAEGKRNAVINFLSLVIKRNSPTTLFLFSDENIEWLTEDPKFTAKWAALLFKVIQNGNKIKIIHVINRNLDEMLLGIEKWLPLYMTGAIEPYYYPKSRDGIFKRTLFIALDTAVVTSSSVGDGVKSAANFFYTDKNTIAALTEEYQEYFSLCRPLMRIFTPNNPGDYLSVLTEFEEEEGNSVLKNDMFSAITMPFDVAESICSRIDEDNRGKLLSYHQNRIQRFENSLHNYYFTEIVPIPDLRTIQSGKVMVYFPHMFTPNPVFYTPKEFSKHLQHVVKLLQTFDTYNVHLVPASKIDGCSVYCKEDVGVIIEKSTPPAITFAINESNMNAAFWDYMRLMLGKQPRDKTQRSITIDTINTIAETLKDL
ncbi:MAG: transcriptional regulator [Syntrophomonadaceae bacterium]|nr:transcriptional regulator [Syntrophomonadaceae bacterium]